MWRLQAASRHRKVSTLFLDFFSLQNIYKLTLIDMKKLTLALLWTLAFSSLASAYYSVKSPDGSLEARVDVGDKITLGIYSGGKPLMENIEIGLQTDRGNFGGGLKVVGVKNTSADKLLKTVYGVNSVVRDFYNQISIDFKSFNLVCRAYDEAVAYRIVSRLGEGQMKVLGETLNLNLSPDAELFASFALGDFTSYEELYSKIKVADAAKKHSAILPLIVKAPSAKVAIVESDVESYPMLRFVSDKDAGLKARFVKYPKTMKMKGNIMLGYDTFEDFIAKTDATRAFPWRAFIVAKSDADLAVNDTVYKLAEPSRISDVAWIEFGPCAWEWWSDWTLKGVDFKTGVNEKTYKAYIDFASENSIPYIVFDAGWLVGRDVGGMGPDIHERIVDGKPYLDVKKLIEYAHERDVKVVLWCLGQSLNKYGEKAIKLMKSWGADGVKVDFFNRDDQTAMDLYYRIAKICAENKMIVDFHGCAKPAGLQRTYPNVVNFEAVRGLEMNKVNKIRDPVFSDHDVNLVMTRMLQGPMDYTPGAMRNVSQGNFKANYSMPESATTRAHQGALFVLFYAPLQMLCDSPSRYAMNQDFTSFIASVPTTWDESKAICGELGEYVVVARRKGDVWYVAGICSQKGRSIEIDLSKIVPEGEYTAEILSDTPNSGKDPEDYLIKVRDVFSNQKLKFELKSGGGFAVKLIPDKFPIFSDIIRALFEE